MTAQRLQDPIMPWFVVPMLSWLSVITVHSIRRSVTRWAVVLHLGDQGARLC
jgi:hypothetical protein